MAILTLFTTCKPFTGEFGRIQTNALRSWAKLQPACEIIVLGNEAGVAPLCRELGLRYVEFVERNTHGTPLLRGLFTAAEAHARTELLGFANADILLTGDLLPAVERSRRRFEKFLLIVRRWNVNLDTLWDFSTATWESRLRAYAKSHGRLEPLTGGMDCFVFTRGMWQGLPPFAVGRTACDNALIYSARKDRVPVIDATPVVTCVHQNHGYSHLPENTPGAQQGSEGLTHLTLVEDGDFIRFNAVNATHVFGPWGIRRRIDMNPINLYRRLAVLPSLYPCLRPFLPLIHRSTQLARELRARANRWRQLTPCAAPDAMNQKRTD